MICGLIFPGDSRVSLAVKGAVVVTSATVAVAEAADFLDDSIVAAVCWVGDIILGDVSVM